MVANVAKEDNNRLPLRAVSNLSIRDVERLMEQGENMVANMAKEDNNRLPLPY